MEKVLLAGYGTFITDAVETLREDMTAKIYYWNVRILGAAYLNGWRRVLLPRDTHPYIIKDISSKVKVLVVETNFKNLKLIDDAEGYPYHYDRIKLDTKFGKVLTYIPRQDVLDKLMSKHKAFEIKDDEWEEWIERSVKHNKIAIENFSKIMEMSEK